MISSEYLENSQEYSNLYPQTVMDSDSQDSPSYKRPAYLPSHASKQHFDCFCGKIFISKADFNRHMLVHTGERPHDCKVCGRAFSLKGNLTKHMMLHTEEKSYHCPECGKAFLKKQYIDQHMRVHTGERPFMCPMCNRAFSLKGNLTQHMKLHTDEKSFHCLECSKMFLKKSYLIQHMRVHSGSKPHECSMCNKAFNLKGNLVQHMMRHSGRKPFECLECGKSFALKGALREHEKVHGGDKPFVCNVCSKAFNKKSYLVQHERTHTGERPFPCLECGKAFSQRSILNQHMKQHGERSYKCIQCRKIFLKKLSTINKSIKEFRFSGFKCEECEDDPSEESKLELGGNISGAFMKQESAMGEYDAQNYVQDDMSMYNLDGSQKVEDLDRMRLTKLPRLEEDYSCSTHKQNSTAPAPESNGQSGRVFQYESQSAQPPQMPATQDGKKFVNYNQKKTAFPSTSKEISKKSHHSQTNANSLMNHNKPEVLPEQHKRIEATYTELKVVEKHRIPGSNPKPQASGINQLQSTSTVVGGKHPGKLNSLLKMNEDKAKCSKNNAIDNLKGAVDPSKASSNTDGKSVSAKDIPDQSNKIAEEMARNYSDKALEYAPDHSNKIAEEMARNYSDKALEYAPDHSNKIAEEMARNYSDKALEYALKKHPALLSVDGQNPVVYSQSSLSDYNARNMDSLRYIENLQRNFASGVRHGNIPEVESALSRFGIKGYYTNSPWSFTGTYPE